MLFAALLTVSVAALGADATDSVCSLNLQTQLRAKDEPLILEANEMRDKTQKLEILRPQVEVVGGKSQGVVHVQDGKKLLIACPGLNNVVKASLKQTSYAECSSGRLTINNKPATADSLSCTHGVANSWVKDTGEKCGKGEYTGTKFELGFRLTDDSEESFFPLVDVCHNIDKMVTYYTAHQLYGASLNGAVKSSERRPFSMGPKGMQLFAGVNADKCYSQKGQKEALDVILGKGAQDKYTSPTVFLARGHLSPDADFIYHSGQLMTYYFINVAPQWQSFNAFNWLGVENAVRKLAAKEDTTLNVWTGTWGILKLEDMQGVEREIYLDPKEAPHTKPSRRPRSPPGGKPRGPGDKPNPHPKPGHHGGKPKPGPHGKPKPGPPGKPEPHDEPDTPRESHIPVPEVYWKLVQHPVTHSCTVAVGHNNVWLKAPPTPICTPVEVDGWPTLDALDRGYTYYCEYEDFKNTVTYVPDVECSDLFKFPH